METMLGHVRNSLWEAKDGRVGSGWLWPFPCPRAFPTARAASWGEGPGCHTNAETVCLSTVTAEGTRDYLCLL